MVIIYALGFHLNPQFWHTLRGLPEPINPVIIENPLFVVTIAVDPHFGQAITFLSLTTAFIIGLFSKTVFLKQIRYLAEFLRSHRLTKSVTVLNRIHSC